MKTSITHAFLHEKENSKAIIFLMALLSIFCCQNLYAQNTVTTRWKSANGLQDTLLRTPTCTDDLGNVYVAGFTLNPTTGADILVVKLDSKGDTLWSTTFSGSGNYRDQATAIALDADYNVVIGGFSYYSSGHNYDFIVLEYDSTGTQQFVTYYDGGGADGISAISLDGNAIYATGASAGTAGVFDYATIKVDNTGSLIWSKRYDYVLADVPFDLVATDNVVIVTGGSQGSFTDWDYATVKYSQSTGVALDTIRITGTGFGFDHANEVVTDWQGYIYITGTYANISTGLDYKTVKMDQQGNIKWIETYDRVGDDDEANSVAVDYDGNVYVTGQSKNSIGNNDYCTIKYDSLGNQQWVRFYNNGYNDIAHKIAYGDDNNIYITGESGNSSNQDFATVGYETDGDSLWTIRFKGVYNGDDIATDITAHDGYIYVSGQSRTGPSTWQYITIAYGEATYEVIPDPFNETPGSAWFYPNLGQLANDTGATVSYIDYYSQNQSPSVYFNQSHISYVFRHVDNDTATTDTLQRVDVHFIDQSGNRIQQDIYEVGKPGDHYLNFYLPQCSAGITEVRGIKTLFVERLYRGIDLYFTSNAAGSKYYFTIDKNENPSNINIQIHGEDSITHSIGTYSIHTSIGVLKFDSLFAYEIDATGAIIPNTMQPVDIFADTIHGYWHFVPFSYNASNKLVIMAKKNIQMSGCSAIPGDLDQGNIFHSTFYGETTTGMGFEDNNEYSTGMTTDDEGNIYITGFTNSTFFPTTTGAYQVNPGGIKDGLILCFDNNMVRKWATFIGGSNSDTLTCVTYNPNDDNIYFGGTTASSNHPFFPQSSPSNEYWDNSYNGNQDAIFGQCSKGGNMNLITYIGGSGYDKGMGICVTGDVVILTGNTKSTNITTSCTAPSNGSFPTCSTAGDFVKTANSGGQDIFLMKFDTDNSLIWSTLIGSSANDKVFDIEPYPVHRSTGSYFYLCGETQKTSNTGPFDGSVLTNGDMPLKDIPGSAYFQSMAGGFVMEFNDLGGMVWATTINGTKDLQTLTFANNSIYLAGTCNATAVVNTCSESASGVSICFNSGEFNKNTGELYVARFNTGGELTYSTLYNAELTISTIYAFDLHLDKIIDMDANTNGDIFILTVGVENPDDLLNNFEPVSPAWAGCYYQPNSIIGFYGEEYDCAILSFNSQNQINWGSFFGGGSNATTFFGPSYPLFTEFPGAIACFQNKDLFIAGYSGKECSTFPLVDAGTTPTGQAYYYDDLPNSYQTTNLITAHADYDIFATKFDMAAVNVGLKEAKTENIYRNSVYPTITDNYVNILLNAYFSNSVNIELVDLAGNIIINSSVKLNGINQSLRWDLSSFSKGIYFIRIVGQDGNSESFKIIKK